MQPRNGNRVLLVARITLAIGVLMIVGDSQALVQVAGEVAGIAWIEAISRPQTVANLGGPPAPKFREALSRAQTVHNIVADDTFDYREAISRAHTVQNDAFPPPVYREAISRSQTVYNDVIPPPVYREAISRSQTVNNKTIRKVQPAEAISRASTVLNQPELRLELQSEIGDTTAYARCGETIRYRVVGTMSDKNNQGLALVGFDMRFNGGTLLPVETPNGPASCDNPMAGFSSPAGLTEPAGFGGAPVAAQGPQCGHPTGTTAGLNRLGGAQNTFKHSGGAPNGVVLTGVAQPNGCGTAVIAEGTLVAPSTPGEYRLWIENAIANAVAKDATGNPYWRTRRAVVNVHGELSLIVVESRCQPSDFDYFLFTQCFSGPGGTPSPSPLYISLEECLADFDDDNDGDVDLYDSASVQRDFRPGPCPRQRILASSPNSCTNDAAQPTSRNGQFSYGFDAITLKMSCPTAGLALASFGVSTMPAGSAPTIQSVAPSSRDMTLRLSGPISPGRWTCFTHTASNSKACLGFLPGDVNRNGTVDDADADTLEGWLANPPPGLSLDRCDINRDGVCNAADFTRLINLFDGDDEFDFWFGRTLPTCPSGL
jgi:hypothetical protein